MGKYLKHRKYLPISGMVGRATVYNILYTCPSDKMSDDFEFGSDICMMMSDA
jgi:hypothetical protein